MEGYYTKKKAANVLGVTERQISNYLREKTLSVIYQGRRAWIPKEEVTALFARVTWGKPPNSEDMQEVLNRLKSLETEVEVLKLGLGFGAKTGPRGEADLLVLRQKFMDYLAEDKWTNRQISSIADDLMSIHEQELYTLIQRIGSVAWVPLDHLSTKMLGYLEGKKNYPDGGLGVLHTRLSRSRDRFLGLVYATSKLPARRREESATLMGLLKRIGPLDDAVLGYILALQ